jgi:CubicO group peptidase (beta-lactamase class C family)
MKRYYVSIVTITFFCLFISATAAAELYTAKPEEVGLSSERLNQLGASLKAHIEKGVIPGGVALVARKGKIAYFESFGMRELETSSPMQKDTIFEIYSMTKPIVSVGTMILQEQGRIFVRDPVSKYIPEFKEMKVGVESTDSATGEKTFSTVPAQREMTIQDLLCHTSGLTYSYFGGSKVNMMYKEAGIPSYDQTLAEMVTKLSKLPLAYQPGTTWQYSRGADVLGRIIEIVSGMSLDKFLEENIFKPLKMNETGYYVNPEDLSNVAKPGPNAQWPAYYPTSLPKLCPGTEGLVSKAHDMIRFVQMLLNGGQLDGVRILGKNTVEYMTSDHLGSIPKKGPSYYPGPGYGFGLGFAVRESLGVANIPGSVGDYYWSGAGGLSFYVNPREELCAVYMAKTNTFGLDGYLVSLFRVLTMQAIVD